MYGSTAVTAVGKSVTEVWKSASTSVRPFSVISRSERTLTLWLYTVCPSTSTPREPSSSRTICSEFKRQLLVVQRSVHRGVADKGDVAPPFILANRPAKPVAAQIGRQQVGNNCIHRMILQETECFLIIRSDDYRMTFGFQQCTQAFAIGIVVIRDQNIHSSTCGKIITPWRCGMPKDFSWK